MSGSIDGAECEHGVCVFDPRGCHKCGTALDDHESFCSLGRDCLCVSVNNRPDPKCKHHRSMNHVSTARVLELENCE